MIYTPKHYTEHRTDVINEIIHRYSFATLISVTDNGPIISHLPVIMDSEKKTLLSHCARANPHWKHFKDENPVTVIFSGPHSYISPAWYEPHPDNVPTWNYVAVHVKGAVRIVEDNQEAWLLMNKLVQHYENYYRTGWSLPSEPNETLKNDIQRGITVFEIKMDQVEAKFKLSQNLDLSDRNSVIEKLPLYTGEQGSLVAEYMKQTSKK